MDSILKRLINAMRGNVHGFFSLLCLLGWHDDLQNGIWESVMKCNTNGVDATVDCIRKVKMGGG